jgi:hypothetical protein
MTKLLSTSAVLIALASPAFAETLTPVQYMARHSSCHYLIEENATVDDLNAAVFTAVSNGDVQHVTITRETDLNGNEFVCTQVESSLAVANRQLLPREYNAYASPTEAICPQPDPENDRGLCWPKE